MSKVVPTPMCVASKRSLYRPTIFAKSVKVPIMKVAFDTENFDSNFEIVLIILPVA